MCRFILSDTVLRVPVLVLYLFLSAYLEADLAAANTEGAQLADSGVPKAACFSRAIFTTIVIVEYHFVSCEQDKIIHFWQCLPCPRWPTVLPCPNSSLAQVLGVVIR